MCKGILFAQIQLPENHALPLTPPPHIHPAAYCPFNSSSRFIVCPCWPELGEQYPGPSNLPPGPEYRQRPRSSPYPELRLHDSAASPAYHPPLRSGTCDFGILGSCSIQDWRIVTNPSVSGKATSRQSRRQPALARLATTARRFKPPIFSILHSSAGNCVLLATVFVAKADRHIRPTFRLMYRSR